MSNWVSIAHQNEWLQCPFEWFSQSKIMIRITQYCHSSWVKTLILSVYVTKFTELFSLNVSVFTSQCQAELRRIWNRLCGGQMRMICQVRMTSTCILDSQWFFRWQIYHCEHAGTNSGDREPGWSHPDFTLTCLLAGSYLLLLYLIYGYDCLRLCWVSQTKTSIHLCIICCQPWFLQLSMVPTKHIQILDWKLNLQFSV